ncbi:MAG: helix-hairpin-helix domain-containing protein, partial [Alphaproteobacteria bacterium]|nr:helix-hairpin-helix domain-containing protein [Alphaproteobacteria bacterium]
MANHSRYRCNHMDKHTLTDIKGVGKAAAERLQEAGFKTVDDVAGASVDALSKVSGFGGERAKTIIAAAKALDGGEPAPAKAEPAPKKAKPAPEPKVVAKE